MLCWVFSPLSRISTSSLVTNAPMWAIPPWTKSDASGKRIPPSPTTGNGISPFCRAPDHPRSHTACPKCSKPHNGSPISPYVSPPHRGWTTGSIVGGCPRTYLWCATPMRYSPTPTPPSSTPARLHSKRHCSAAPRSRSITSAARTSSPSSGACSSRCGSSPYPISSSDGRQSARNWHCTSPLTRWRTNSHDSCMTTPAAVGSSATMTA